MLVIRLQRTGRKNLATYRIVVAEKARAAKGQFHEIIGHYLPARKDPVFTVQADRVEHWVKQGAIPSDTAARLFKNNGLKGMEKFVMTYAKRRSKNAPAEEPAAAPAPTPAAPVAEAAPEAPATEAPVETPVAEAAAEAAPETPAA
jgi:small subunit ribosomal protein S16